MIFLLSFAVIGWVFAISLAAHEFYADKQTIERVEKRNRWWSSVTSANNRTTLSDIDGDVPTADGRPAAVKANPNLPEVQDLMRRIVWPAVPFVIMACLVLGLLFMPAWALRTVLILWTIAVSVCIFLVMRLRER